ncbi:MAG TPA: DUF6146 family protein [Faecalibacter sp.]
MRLAILLIIIGFLSFTNCAHQVVQNQPDTESNKLTFKPDENGEYDIIVFDPQYDIFLKTHARPQNYQSHEFYKNRNRFYVSIWNQRHMMPSVYNPDLYAVSIDLDPNIEYGHEFEYKLYQFFKFIEWKYRVRFM